MRTSRFCLVVAVIVVAASCASAPPLPDQRADDSSTQTLVWVGHGECERLENGAWVRRPEFDYDFSVEQHRFADQHWESIKSMRRRHPAYDNSAGPRAQTLFFTLDMSRGTNDVTGALRSTLGAGTLRTDAAFRDAVIDINADVSSMAPFDRYRITQHYDYEGGTLSEVVELNKGEQQWVRNREVARLYAPSAFTTPPTTATITAPTTQTTTAATSGSP